MELIRTEFKLRTTTQGQRLNSNCGPLMQGVIMERIRPEYGEVLHISELKPYSQYLIHEANEDTWVLQTLTHDSGNEIWNIAAIKQLEKFRLEHNDMEIGVAERSFTKLSEDELLNQTFFGDCPRKVSVDFVTPTAFKSGGAYVNYPTIRHVFQSLLNKFNAVSTNSSLDVDMVLGDIENNIAVTGYRLKSTYFHLEGIRIPSFVGSLSLVTKGPQQMANLAYMLLKFGTYSGIGIKTAMGMGGMRIAERNVTRWRQ